jgi:membrane fusion protein (multidrug efflux system)
MTRRMSTRVTREQRFPVWTRVQLEAPGQATAQGYLQELGRAGMTVLVDAAAAASFEPGARRVVTFELPDGGLVRLAGTLTWAAGDFRDRWGRPCSGVGIDLLRDEPEAAATLDRFIAGFRPTVLVVDDEADNLDGFRRALRRDYHVLGASSGREALALLDHHEVAVLMVDQMMPEMSGKELLEQVQARFPRLATVRLVASGVTDASVMRDFINTGRIFYFLQKPVAPADLLAVVKSAVAEYWTAAAQAIPEPPPAVEQAKLERTQRILEYTRRLAMQRDIATAGRLAVEAVESLTAADRGAYLIYDPVSDTLWSQVEGQRPAVAGLTGFVARTGKGIELARASDDPRFHRELDDPSGEADEHLAIEPILDTKGLTLGLLVAVRRSDQPAFGRDEIDALKTFAAQCASAFGQMTMQAEIERIFSRQEAQARAQTSGGNLFRREAIDAHAGRQMAQGSLLQISPRWMNLTYRFLALLLVAAITYLALGTLTEYATGPAVVRVEGRIDITANAAGTVAAVEVQPGQRVAAKQLLVRFYDAQESAELDRIDREFELQLVKTLRSASDQEARTALGLLRAQKEQAQSRLESRSVRAPSAGVVSDVRIRTGQLLGAGDIVLTLVRDDARFGIVAMLPGQYRPLLKPHMPMRLELSGFRFAYRELEIDTIGDEVIGPAEARRYLGAEIADTVTLPSSVILVRAHLPTRDFSVDGRTFAYHDGMQGTAEARVRTEPILFSLVPGLKAVFEGQHG